jgi:hypothetical protein
MITVTLPPRFLARDVHIRIEKAGSRWAIVAVDAVGNAWPVTLEGAADTTRYHSKSGAETILQLHGGHVGMRVFAQPVERF